MNAIKIFPVVTFVFAACEPGLTGQLKVFNESGEKLTVFVLVGVTDTVKTEIDLNSSQVIKVLGGIGSNEGFKCCPCEVDTIWIRSTLGPVKKNAYDASNWQVPNRSKLKKFFGPDIKCEFYVRQEDL